MKNQPPVESPKTLRWRRNGRDGVSNHQPQQCALNRLFRRRSKKISKLRVTGLCAGKSPGTGEFPAQMASNEENVSISWRHHDMWPMISLPLARTSCRTNSRFAGGLRRHVAQVTSFYEDTEYKCYYRHNHKCIKSLYIINMTIPFQWHHNGLDGVSNHQPHHWLPKRLFMRRSNKTSKLRVTGIYAGNSPGTDDFPTQISRNAENVSIWWRYHAIEYISIWFHLRVPDIQMSYSDLTENKTSG